MGERQRQRDRESQMEPRREPGSPEGPLRRIQDLVKEDTNPLGTGTQHEQNTGPKCGVLEHFLSPGSPDPRAFPMIRPWSLVPGPWSDTGRDQPGLNLGPTQDELCPIPTEVGHRGSPRWS